MTAKGRSAPLQGKGATSKGQRAVLLPWTPITALSLRALDDGQGRFLNVSLGHLGSDLWMVAAVESSALSSGQNAKDVVDDVFDDHSHDNLGTFPLAKAVARAEAYVKSWLAGRARKAKCACKPIARPKALLSPQQIARQEELKRSRRRHLAKKRTSTKGAA